MRKLTIHIRSDHNEWTEEYREGERGSFSAGTPDLDTWAFELVLRFNEGLRPAESPRHVVKTEITEISDSDIKRDHKWQKTNLVTIIKGTRSYDTARCETCGITAKRFGLGGYTRDPKFAAEKYEVCSGKSNG